MDRMTEYLASYGSSIQYEDIPAVVRQKVKGLLIDTIACGIGGYASGPGEIVRRIAGRVCQTDMPATILGSGQKSSPDLATFANGVMIRYLDLNDGFVSKGRGHPSDNFAPVLTCADAVHAGGKEIMVASVLAYEVFCRLFDQFDISKTSFDHAVTVSISSALGASKVLNLSQEQMIEALNLTIVPSLSLQQTRAGELSMWKACASANAARNAVFAVLLAKEGMTGPSPVFQGKFGFFRAVAGPFELDEFGGQERPFRVMNVSMKRYPCGQHAQTVIDAANIVRSKLSDINDIAEIHVGTFTAGKTRMADDDEKWHPKTRETADHSIPYVVAVTLMYGPLEIKHFADEILQNGDLLDLIQKIKVEESKECNDLYPEASANRVEVITKSGKHFSELVKYHRGHHQNPLNDEEIEQKFHTLTKDHLSQIKRERLLSLLWNLEQLDDASKIMELLRI